MLSVDEQTLYVLPDDYDRVLEALGAEPAEDGWFRMNHEVATLLPTGLGVSYAPSTLLFQVIFADGFEPDGAPAGTSYVSKTGTYYRVYRDAACSSTLGAPDQWTLSECEGWVWPQGLGESRRRYTGPWGTCQRWWGSSCVELLEPIRIEFFYRDAECNLLVGARPTMALACPL